MTTDPIIRYAEMGDGTEEFDEFIATGCDIHLERMGEAQWWLSVITADGREWAINVGAVNTRAKGYGICEEDA